MEIKLLFLLGVASMAGQAMKAQDSGNVNMTVSEDRIWNYNLRQRGANASSVNAFGFHFEGQKEIDGVSYNIFRDGEGREVAYLREEGG